MNKLLPLALFAIITAGCSGSGSPASVNPDDYVQKKIDAMTKIADVIAQGSSDTLVILALEDYRGVPFEANKQQDAAKTILAIYQTRIKDKVKGEVAADLAGEMAILERVMKSPAP